MTIFKLKQQTVFLKVLLMIVLIVTDQVSKYFADITTCNSRISWGIPIYGWLLWVLLIFSFILLLYIIKTYSFKFSLLLIIAGGLGNLIDRLHSGCVIDFISIALPFNLPFIGNTFPTFNVADVFITIGVIVFCYQELLTKQK